MTDGDFSYFQRGKSLELLTTGAASFTILRCEVEVVEQNHQGLINLKLGKFPQTSRCWPFFCKLSEWQVKLSLLSKIFIALNSVHCLALDNGFLVFFRISYLFSNLILAGG